MVATTSAIEEVSATARAAVKSGIRMNWNVSGEVVLLATAKSKITECRERLEDASSGGNDDDDDDAAVGAVDGPYVSPTNVGTLLGDTDGGGGGGDDDDDADGAAVGAADGPYVSPTNVGALLGDTVDDCNCVVVDTIVGVDVGNKLCMGIGAVVVWTPLAT